MPAAPKESTLPSRAKRASNPSGYFRLFPSNSDYIRPVKISPGAKIASLPHHCGWLTKGNLLRFLPLLHPIVDKKTGERTLRTDNAPCAPEPPFASSPFPPHTCGGGAGRGGFQRVHGQEVFQRLVRPSCASRKNGRPGKFELYCRGPSRSHCGVSMILNTFARFVRFCGDLVCGHLDL